MKFSELKENLNEYIEQNDDADLPEFLLNLDDITIGADTVESQLENGNEELKDWYQSKSDKKVSKAIDTYKDETLPELAEKKAKEMNNNGEGGNDKVDEVMEKMEELEQEVKKQKKEKKREQLKNTVNKKLTDAGYSNMTHLTDTLLGEDEEETAENVENFIESLDEKTEEVENKTTEELAQKFGTNPEEITEEEEENNNSGGLQYDSM